MIKRRVFTVVRRFVQAGISGNLILATIQRALAEVERHGYDLNKTVIALSYGVKHCIIRDLDYIRESATVTNRLGMDSSGYICGIPFCVDMELDDGLIEVRVEESYQVSLNVDRHLLYNCLLDGTKSNNEEENMIRKLKIKKVIYNNPATIVYWEDGSRTVVKAMEGDVFDKEKGLAMAMCKRMNDDDAAKFHEIFRKWCK